LSHRECAGLGLLFLQDEILRNAVVRYEGKCWKKIAQCLQGRTDVQCLHRWQKVLKPGLVKGPWTTEVGVTGVTGLLGWHGLVLRVGACWVSHTLVLCSLRLGCWACLRVPVPPAFCCGRGGSH
jgi:hypothetical protein